MININGIDIHLPTKESWGFVHEAAGGSAVGQLGAVIDGVGESASATLVLPHDYHTTVSIVAMLLPLATGADMHLDIVTVYAAAGGGENYNVHTETGNARDVGATVTNQYLAHSIADLVDVAGMVAGDILNVQVAYDAAVVATNAYYVGLRLRYI